MSTNLYNTKKLSELIGISEGTIRTYSERPEISELFKYGRLPSENMIPFLNRLMTILGYKPRTRINLDLIKMPYAKRLIIDARNQYIDDNKPYLLREVKKWTNPENELLYYSNDLTVVQNRLRAINSERTLYAIAKQKNRLTQKNV